VEYDSGKNADDTPDGMTGLGTEVHGPLTQGSFGKTSSELTFFSSNKSDWTIFFFDKSLELTFFSVKRVVDRVVEELKYCKMDSGMMLVWEAVLCEVVECETTGGGKFVAWYDSHIGSDQ
jgi:hypothetical protein